MGRPPIPIEQRFWTHVDKNGPNGCWLWTGKRWENGYGVVWLDRTERAAHRVSWLMTHGPIPPGLFACHRCDNPPCVNPAHLFLGTQADNQRDKCQKNRQARGVALPVTVLTPDDVRAIRATSGVKHSTLAKQYGVVQSTITRIINRKRWTYL